MIIDCLLNHNCRTRHEIIKTPFLGKRDFVYTESKNVIGRDVKIADLEDNMDFRRQAGLCHLFGIFLGNCSNL